MIKYYSDWSLNKICRTHSGGDVPDVTLNTTRGNAKIAILSDVHIGQTAFNKTLFEKYLAYIQKHNVYVILAGDLMEFAVPTHIPQAMWEQEATTAQQFVSAKNYFNPIRNRILYCTGGNHEWRSYKKVGIDISLFLAQELGCFYNPTAGPIFINVGTQRYKFLIFHGASSSQSNIFLELEKAWSVYPETDLVAAGHNHHLAHRAVPKRVSIDGTLQRRYVHFVRTGSFLTDAIYGLTAGYPPTLDGAPIITLNGDSKHISVDATGEAAEWLD